MDKDSAQKIVDLLVQARRRPEMFFPADYSGISGFLGGIQALQRALFGVAYNETLTTNLLKERGWDTPNSLAPWPEMKDRGLDIHAMIEEVLTIEIEILRRSYNL